MSFRQYGGINYAAKNNIVKNNYSNANNLSVMTKVGQPSSIINFESDVSANIIYSNLTVDNLTVKNSSTHKESLDVSGDALINGLTVGQGKSINIFNTVLGINALSNANTSTGNYGWNTAIGHSSLNQNTSGYWNTAVGGQALRDNVSGYWNTAVGVNALLQNTSGYWNTALGNDALYSNNSSVYNTAVGYRALYTQVTAGITDENGIWINNGDNTAIGVGALYSTNGVVQSGTPNILSGAWNTAVGLNALYNNTTGSNNTAIGLQAGCYGPSTANKCTFLGAETSSKTSSPIQSTAIGYMSQITADHQIMMGTSSETVKIPGTLTVDTDALINGLTVGQGKSISIGNTVLGINALPLANTTVNTLNSAVYGLNTAIGSESLFNNTSGGYNTALGYQALNKNSNGYSNTAVGLQALLKNSSGLANTAIGTYALFNTTNNNNTAIGSNSLFDNVDGNNNTAIGYQSGCNGKINCTYCTFIGSDSNSNGDYFKSTALGYGSLITDNNQIMLGTSTENVQIPGTLTVVKACEANSFNAASDYRIKENVLNLAGDSSFSVDNLRPVTYKNILSGKQDMGFIAHELQEQYPFLVTGEKDGAEKQSVNYIGLIALLVKEIQELKQDIKILKTNL